MKIWKRNAVIATVLVLVCAGIYRITTGRKRRT